ncbi:hypothetical protein, partial [Paulownia witches'-broom phytoplasma]|uniref:hypothetical protein n=1 Tax=Paulownia witches'-broom phytoplasma TaxID=39647 RepID=UPI0030DDACF2
TKLKNTKIQEKQEHWFKRILKSIRNTIIVILPLILIIVALWFIIANFFPEIAAKIGPVAKAVWDKIKDLAYYINERGKNFLEWLGFPLKLIPYIFNSIIIAIGFIVGLSCLGIPVIGPFVGWAILIATTIYTGITWWNTSNQQTPKEDSPPKPLVEVYDLDAIKKEQEEKVKQELIEYATELQKQGKSSEEMEKQTKNKKEELLQDLQKKKKTTNQLN